MNHDEAYADIEKVSRNLKEAQRLIREAEDIMDKYDVVGLDILRVYKEVGLGDERSALHALSGRWKD